VSLARRDGKEPLEGPLGPRTQTVVLATNASSATSGPGLGALVGQVGGSFLGFTLADPVNHALYPSSQRLYQTMGGTYGLELTFTVVGCWAGSILIVAGATVGWALGRWRLARRRGAADVSGR